MDVPLAESPACPEWRETEYQSFLRAISWSPSLSLIKPMRSDSACKWLSLRSFSLDIVDQLSVECSAGWYAGMLDSVASPFERERRRVTAYSGKNLSCSNPSASSSLLAQEERQKNWGFPIHVASTEKIHCLDRMKFNDGILLSLPKFSFTHMTLFL